MMGCRLPGHGAGGTAAPDSVAPPGSFLLAQQQLFWRVWKQGQQGLESGYSTAQALWRVGWAARTFLPPPDRDGVLRVHSHRHQQLSGGAEVDIIHPF